MHPAKVVFLHRLLLNIYSCVCILYMVQFFSFVFLSLYVLCVQYIIQRAEYNFLHEFSSGVFTVSSPDYVGIYCSSVTIGSFAPWSRWLALANAELSPLFSSCDDFPGSSWRDWRPTTCLLAYCLSRPPFRFMRWYNWCGVVGVPLLRRFWSFIPFRLLPGPRWCCLALLTLLAVHAQSIEWVFASFHHPSERLSFSSYKTWIISSAVALFKVPNA